METRGRVEGDLKALCVKVGRQCGALGEKHPRGFLESAGKCLRDGGHVELCREEKREGSSGQGALGTWAGREDPQ